MTELVKIASWSGRSRRGNVIFVHGLGGHVYETWRRTPENDSFWPLWLAEDIPGLAVYSLSYAAPTSNWVGTAMPLQDRAVNVLECLLSEMALRQSPTAFICHSLGGLVIKQVLKDASEQKDRRPDVADLLNCVQEVVFIATPHTGSRHANWLERLRFLAWPSRATANLVANDPSLRSLNVSYRELAIERRLNLRHLIFYEMLKTPAGLIVDEGSGDAGLPDCRPIPIDANHLSICKPLNRNSLLYRRIRDFVSELGPESKKRSVLEVIPLRPIKIESSLNFVPLAIRIVALLAIGILISGGVYAIENLGRTSFNQTIRIDGNQNSVTQIGTTPASTRNHQSVAREKSDGVNNQVFRENIR